MITNALQECIRFETDLMSLALPTAVSPSPAPAEQQERAESTAVLTAPDAADANPALLAENMRPLDEGIVQESIRLQHETENNLSRLLSHVGFAEAEQSSNAQVRVSRRTFC